MPQHTWTFSDIDSKQRGSGWVAVLVIAGIALIVYALATLNFLFAFIVFGSGLVLLLGHFRGSRSVKVTIDDNGVTLGNKFFPYNEIQNFWIMYEPPIKLLYIKPKTFFLPSLSFPLEDQNPVDIRAFLRQYTEEDLEREHEPVTDRIMRRLKL